MIHGGFRNERKSFFSGQFTFVTRIEKSTGFKWNFETSHQ